MIASTQIFGRLTVIGEAPKRRKKRVALCRCKCGAVKPVLYQLLRNGKARSCGCLRREEVAKKNHKHGHDVRGKRTAEYRVWLNMLFRCYNKSADRYDQYGGRGIRVSERWKTSFANFLADMGPRPSPNHSIDRKDNNGNYEPGNCRWATRKEQARNTSKTRLVEIRGRMLCLSDAAKDQGIDKSTVYSRMRKGESIEKALRLT
ncbi:MAG: hypothetical protein L0Y72_00775 [Gemmataceae bacterium]|nr:hypothetical protein [Gemmataceae bacterium]